MADSSATQPWSLRQAIEPGRRAVIAHFKPILLIQFLLIIVVVAYYAFPEVREFSRSLSQLRDRGGTLFAAAMSGFAGTVVPELAKFLADRGNYKPTKPADHLFNFLFFAFIGAMVVNLFYVLAILFGDKQDPLTVVIKVAVDMLIFSALISAPISITLQQWRLDGYKMRKTLSRLSFVFFRDRVLPLILVIWAYWGPVGLCSYAMPLSLQLWVYLFAQAAYSFMILHIARGT
ncbi:MAG: hypothetical protein KF784_04330 [Fimbriimonadaceae bacterium]|nr:hypothetical protein [Fimbriimonadaceae bacterium]